MHLNAVKDNLYFCFTQSVGLQGDKCCPFRFNPFPHNPDLLGPSKRNLLKTLWEKEKMLVTSIFSFSHNAFYPSQNRIFVFKSHLSSRLQMLSIWTGLKICCLV